MRLIPFCIALPLWENKMSKELNVKLVEILSSIQSATEKVSDFTISQLPDIVQSYISYGRASALMYAFVFLGLFVFLWIVTIKWEKSLPRDYRGLGYAAGGGVTVIVGIIALIRIEIVLLVWLSPKVWLLQEFAKMIR